MRRVAGIRAVLGVAVTALGAAACAAIIGIEDRTVGDAALLDGATNPDGGDGDVTPNGDDDDTSMTGDGGKKCDPTAAFGTPVALEGVTTGEAEGTARLTDDELTVYYDAVRSDPSDGGDPRHHIYTATRGSKSAGFGAPSLLKGPGLSLNDEEYSGSVDQSGLALLFERFSLTVNKSVIFVSRRETKTGDFAAANAALPDSPGDKSNPFVRGDLDQGFWFSQPTTVGVDAGVVDGGGSLSDARFRIHIATKTGTDAFTGQVVAGIAGIKDDYYPVISADGLTLYFSTNRASATDDKIEIWSVRRKAGGPFENPQPVANVNLAGHENAPSWISPDDCRLYLFRSLGGNPATQDILVASRPAP